MTEWISVKDGLPCGSLEEAENVLITDGEEISVGWYEEEYVADDKNDPLQYSSAVWHDCGDLLKTCYSGWPEVTHWMSLPEPPKEPR